MWNLRQSAGGVPSGEVHYEGRLVETGALFDSSRARGKPFRFTLGEGKVIGGWEVGVSSMQVPESGRRLSAVASSKRGQTDRLRIGAKSDKFDRKLSDFSETK